MKHPIQPLEQDDKGTLRFKKNAIVCHLLDNGNFDLNDLAKMDFSAEDRCQFAQLIGYSLSGYGELSYVSSDEWDSVNALHDDEAHSSTEARLIATEMALFNLRAALRVPVAALYGIHPDDLMKERDA